MERKIDNFFHKWKKDLIRKPLILYGPKQVGKTFSALNFGEKEYKNIAYFNTNNNKELLSIFKKERQADKLILNLSLLCGETILQDDTLLIFDNLDDPIVARTLKGLSSQLSSYHVIGITSRRSITQELKGEEFQFKGMYQLDFEEYLIDFS